MQFIYYILSFIVLVYYTAQVVVLFTENALRDVGLAQLAFKSVHLATGLVIMLPVLLLSFFPLFVDLQTRMLFNEDFSQRYALELNGRGGGGGGRAGGVGLCTHARRFATWGSIESCAR